MNTQILKQKNLVCILIAVLMTASGELVASGVYFYRLTTDDFSATRKMLIMK